MKKIYLLVVVLTTALSSVAQYKCAPSALGRQYAQRGDAHTQVLELPQNRETIYTNDISNCADFEIVNANSAGYTQFIAGINFQCGTNAPSGPAAIAAIASPTASNGFMMVDSDAFGGSTGGDWVENCWFQTVNPINCSAYDHVSLSFYTFYRMWDGGASDGNEYCLVEISTDGVTWPSVTTFEVSEAPAGTRYELWPTMQTQDPVSNPTLKIFDISAGAANQATVYLRFRWKGTWGYAWMVDDIELFETPENDITVLNGYNGNIITDYEYTVIPEMQLGPLDLGAVVANFGYTPQTGTNDIVFKVDGTTYSGADVILAPSGMDTIWTGPLTLPLGVGAHTLSIEAPADDYPNGNTFTKNFEISNYNYGHNTDNDLVQRGFNQDDEVAIGCTYVINQDTQAGGVRVMFGANTTPGLEVTAYIYEVGQDIQDLSYLGDSGPFTVTSGMIGTGNYVTIGFWNSGAVNVSAGSAYVVEIRKEDSSDRLYILSNVLDEDFATVNYGPFGSGNAVNWFIGWNWSPSVQLILNANVAVPEATTNGSLELRQNFPNPATDLTRITYVLEQAEAVTLTVRDVAGRVVMQQYEGVRPSGENRIELNVNALTSGVYSYTIQAGSQSLTRQMMVN